MAWIYWPHRTKLFWMKRWNNVTIPFNNNPSLVWLFKKKKRKVWYSTGIIRLRYKLKASSNTFHHKIMGWKVKINTFGMASYGKFIDIINLACPKANCALYNQWKRSLFFIIKLCIFRQRQHLQFLDCPKWMVIGFLWLSKLLLK